MCFQLSLQADRLSLRGRRQQRLDGRYIISTVGESHANRRTVQDCISHIFDFAKIKIFTRDGNNVCCIPAGQNNFLVQIWLERFLKDDASLVPEYFYMSSL